MTKSEMLRSKPPVNYLEADIIEMVLDMAKTHPEYFNPATFKHATCNRFVLNMWSWGYAGPRFAAKPTRKQIRVAKKEARLLGDLKASMPKLNVSIN